MKKYIVCDACYIIHEEDYDKKIIPLWFPVWQNIFNNDVMAYGWDVTMRSKFDCPVNLIRSTSTHSWDCTIDWLGCDAWNFSVFEMDSNDYVIADMEKNDHMFRIFNHREEAIAYQQKLISKS